MTTSLEKCLQEHNRSWHYVYFYSAIFLFAICLIMVTTCSSDENMSEKSKKECREFVNVVSGLILGFGALSYYFQLK